MWRSANRSLNSGRQQVKRDAPPFYLADQKSRSDHCEKNPGEDRPDYANKPNELYEEDAPDLP
jgi:hypothetical protein